MVDKAPPPPDEERKRLDETIAEVNAMGKSIQPAIDTIFATQKQIDTLLADVNAKATQAIAAGSKIDDAQAVIAKKSEHIEDARKHADEVRTALDTTYTAATKSATEADGQRARAETAAVGAAEQLAAVRVVKGTVDKDAEAIASARKLAEESTAITKTLADIADDISNRIAVYEERLGQLDVACQKQLTEITRLLPGATSAGLAAAWSDRGKTFINPANKWQKTFIWTLIVLIVVAAEGLIRSMWTNTILNYDEIGRLWLTRGPVVGALIWLAMYSSREAALAKRLEEDYAYKAASASSFQGFQQQMSEIGSAATDNTPLAKLCNDTLTTIGNPPGRIYDKHKLTVSPTEHINDTLKEATKNIEAKTE